MEWDTLYIEKKEAVAFLTLDRSASLNAVNDQLTADLEAACRALDTDADLQVVVLRGEGRAFCSGMDLKAAAMALDNGSANGKPHSGPVILGRKERLENL